MKTKHMTFILLAMLLISGCQTTIFKERVPSAVNEKHGNTGSDKRIINLQELGTKCEFALSVDENFPLPTNKKVFQNSEHSQIFEFRTVPIKKAPVLDGFVKGTLLVGKTETQTIYLNHNHENYNAKPIFTSIQLRNTFFQTDVSAVKLRTAIKILKGTEVLYDEVSFNESDLVKKNNSFVNPSLSTSFIHREQGTASRHTLFVVCNLISRLI